MSTITTGGIDLLRLWKQFINKIWIVIAATLVGAISLVLGYILYSHIVGGNKMYQICNDYSISFDFDNYPNGVDYYNAFTWDRILRDDPVVNYALELDKGLDKQDILDSVTGEMLSDYRILTVIVRGTDSEKVKRISDVYKEALPHFADEVDMLSHIDIWTDADIEEYDAYTREGNAAFLGGLIGFIISLLGVLIYYVIDDRIYTETDWANSFDSIPYLGMEESEEYKANLAYLINQKNKCDLEDCYILKSEEFIFDVNKFKEMRNTQGVVLAINLGVSTKEELRKIVYTLWKQDIEILASYAIAKEKK